MMSEFGMLLEHDLGVGRHVGLELACAGFSIETFTSKVVTLSFSAPIGEICVTRALELLVLERLDA